MAKVSCSSYHAMSSIRLFMQRVIILIPARFASTRFPGKPLAKINGKSMISYVVSNCEASGHDFAVVTDNDEIEVEVKRLGAKVVRVDDEVATGSERIALAYQRFFSDKNYDYVLNVQGDEPLLKSNLISHVANSHFDLDVDIFTAIKKNNSLEDFKNPNIVKCVKSEKGNCLYFSRASMPTQEEFSSFNQHIGVYCYKSEALLKFVELPMSPLEKSERLEQLRALENGMTIGACELDVTLIGVDCEEDIKKVEEVLGE